MKRITILIIAVVPGIFALAVRNAFAVTPPSPVILSIQPSGTSMKVTLQSTGGSRGAGEVWVLLTTDTFAGPSTVWTPISTNTLDSVGTAVVTDPNYSARAHRFYRARM